MLVVTTTVGMLHRVHGHTTNLHTHGPVTRTRQLLPHQALPQQPSLPDCCTLLLHSLPLSKKVVRLPSIPSRDCCDCATMAANATASACVCTCCVLSSLPTFGQLLRLALYLKCERPALSMGFSVRPPPATWPTMARHSLEMTCGSTDHARPLVSTICSQSPGCRVITALHLGSQLARRFAHTSLAAKESLSLSPLPRKA